MGVITISRCIAHPRLCIATDCGCIFAVNIAVASDSNTLVGNKPLDMVALLIRQFHLGIATLIQANVAIIVCFLFPFPLLIVKILYSSVIANRNRIIGIATCQAAHCYAGLAVCMSVITYSDFLIIVRIGAFANRNSRCAFSLTSEANSCSMPASSLAIPTDSSLSGSCSLCIDANSRTEIIGI